MSNESANLEYNGEDSSRELGNNWNDYTFNGNTISKDDTSDSDSHAFLVISNIKRVSVYKNCEFKLIYIDKFHKL